MLFGLFPCLLTCLFRFLCKIHISYSLYDWIARITHQKTRTTMVRIFWTLWIYRLPEFNIIAPQFNLKLLKARDTRLVLKPYCFVMTQSLVFFFICFSFALHMLLFICLWSDPSEILYVIYKWLWEYRYIRRPKPLSRTRVVHTHRQQSSSVIPSVQFALFGQPFSLKILFLWIRKVCFWKVLDILSLIKLI